MNRDPYDDEIRSGVLHIGSQYGCQCTVHEFQSVMAGRLEDANPPRLAGRVMFEVIDQGFARLVNGGTLVLTPEGRDIVRDEEIRQGTPDYNIPSAAERLAHVRELAGDRGV